MQCLVPSHNISETPNSNLVSRFFILKLVFCRRTITNIVHKYDRSQFKARWQLATPLFKNLSHPDTWVHQKGIIDEFSASDSEKYWQGLHQPNIGILSQLWGPHLREELPKRPKIIIFRGKENPTKGSSAPRTPDSEDGEGEEFILNDLTKQVQSLSSPLPQLGKNLSTYGLDK